MLKWATFLFGIGVGSLWADTIVPYAPYCIGIGLVLGLYLGLVWMRGK